MRFRPTTAAALVLICAAWTAERSEAAFGSRSGSMAAGTHAGALLDSVAFNAIWDASSGVLPDSACPRWIRAVTDSSPKLTNGTLRIHTTACSQNASFSQRDTALMMPDTVVVEARLRYASGGECVGPCGHYRQAASVAITTSGSTGTLFFVGDNEIFMTNGECAGITSLAVATTDMPHTYRVVVYDGAAVRVYRDGVLALSGHTYASVADHGTSPRIYWGEGSSFAFGSVFWESVRHNAHKSGCTTTGAGPDTRPGPPGKDWHCAWCRTHRTAGRGSSGLSSDRPECASRSSIWREDDCDGFTRASARLVVRA